MSLRLFIPKDEEPEFRHVIYPACTHLRKEISVHQSFYQYHDTCSYIIDAWINTIMEIKWENQRAHAHQF